MQKSKIALATSAAVVGLSSLSYQAARGGTGSTTAKVDIVSDVTVSPVQALDFANIMNNVTTGTEQVAMTSGGNLTTGANLTHVDGTPQVAKFTLKTDDQDGVADTVTVSFKDLKTPNSTNTIDWANFTAKYDNSTAKSTPGAATSGAVKFTSASVPTTGKTLSAYGTLNIDSADTQGSYTSTITVTANRT